MKNITLGLAIALGMTQITQAQVTTTVDCDLMSLGVSSSDTGYVILYHPGGYLTSPPSENVMEWEITDSQGNIIHQETLTGESFLLFNHSIPLTDTMNVTVVLTNDSAIHNGNPVACLIEDQLYWEENNIIPEFPFGSWAILNHSPGVDVSTTSGIEDLTPARMMDHKMYDLLGRELKEVAIGQMYIKNRKIYIKQ